MAAMPTPYFLASNFWAFCGLLLMLGRSVARTGPTRYTFFNLGGWHTPAEYHLMVGFCAIAAVACLVHGRRSQSRQHDSALALSRRQCEKGSA